MKRIYQIGNILSLGFALIMNYLVGAQILNVPSIGEISDKYATLLTPATYAFSIWTLIYLLLTAFVIYQARDLFNPKSENDLPQRTGLYFIIASIANGLWTYVFVSEQTTLSVAVLATLVISLYILLFRLNIANETPSPKTVSLVWWPLLIYAGWVSVALIVNIASWLQSLDITLQPTAAVLILATLLASLVYLLITRNVRELLLASAWGIAAIGIEQLQLASGSKYVAYAALLTAGALVLATTIHGVRQMQLGRKPIDM